MKNDSHDDRHLDAQLGHGHCARAVHYDRTAYAHPRHQQQVLRRAILEHLNRHRLLRATELAAAVAPERAYEAALSAVQRQLAQLLQERLVQRATIAGHTVYALTQRGARELEDLRLQHEPGQPSEAASSPWGYWPAPRALAKRLADRSNPQHTLLIAQTVIAAESRGLRGYTEAELRAWLKKPPLVVEQDDGQRKGLWPDALLIGASQNQPYLIWVEIDRSRRGSQRLSDLVSLVRSAGAAVRVPHPGAQAEGSHEHSTTLRLQRIVVLTRNAAIARANASHLQPRIRVGLTGDRGLVPRSSHSWDVLGDLERRLPDGRVGTVRRVVAMLTMLPWPRPQRDAWFEHMTLPWPLAQGQWPVARPVRFDA